jgi:hypothetical protein
VKGRTVFRVGTSLASAALVLLGIGLGLAFADIRHDDAAIVNDFETRVAKYLEARKKEAGSAPRPTNSPEKLAGAQQDRAAKVQQNRLPLKEIFSQRKLQHICVIRSWRHFLGPRERRCEQVYGMRSRYAA